MKYMVCHLVTLTILLLSCSHQSSDKRAGKMDSPLTASTSTTNASCQDSSFFNSVYFLKEDAEKILGENAYLSDSSSTIKKDTLEIKRAYTANSNDQKTGKTGVIYFMIEEYAHESSAKHAYEFFRVANQDHEGVEVIHDMGDEAYFHSDHRNFYFVLVRKGSIMFRMKVNKITSHTSLTEFKLISKKISDSL